MSGEREVLAIRILDKEYTISCLPEERDSLVAAAGELNDRMREMRDGAKVLGSERMAVMAALNVIHERDQLRTGQQGTFESARRTVDRLESKLEAAIGRHESG